MIRAAPRQCRPFSVWLRARAFPKRPEVRTVALSYLSLVCAVLFGIAGQIALKSGAVGAARLRRS